MVSRYGTPLGRSDRREMDSIGGMLDAFTSKEQICFNAKVLDEPLPIAFDVIADLVLRPKFDSDDVRKSARSSSKKSRWTGQIRICCFTRFSRAASGAASVGRPILGTPETSENSIVSRSVRVWKLVRPTSGGGAAGNVTTSK